jgi:hypothetical protein
MNASSLALAAIFDNPRAGRRNRQGERCARGAEQLLAVSVDDFIGQPDADFDPAVKRVLSKNRELYRRLA